MKPSEEMLGWKHDALRSVSVLDLLKSVNVVLSKIIAVPCILPFNKKYFFLLLHSPS